MGTYLSTPVTTKRTESGSDLSDPTTPVRWAVVDMQGWRKKMEDAHVARTDILIPAAAQHAKVFAVFDGHGGAEVARFCQMHLVDVLTSRAAWEEMISSHMGTKLANGDASLPVLGNEDGNIVAQCMARALIDSFHSLDRMIDDPNSREEIERWRFETPPHYLSSDHNQSLLHGTVSDEWKPIQTEVFPQHYPHQDTGLVTSPSSLPIRMNVHECKTVSAVDKLQELHLVASQESQSQYLDNHSAEAKEEEADKNQSEIIHDQNTFTICDHSNMDEPFSENVGNLSSDTMVNNEAHLIEACINHDNDTPTQGTGVEGLEMELVGNLNKNVDEQISSQIHCNQATVDHKEYPLFNSLINCHENSDDEIEWESNEEGETINDDSDDEKESKDNSKNKQLQSGTMVVSDAYSLISKLLQINGNSSPDDEDSHDLRKNGDSSENMSNSNNLDNNSQTLIPTQEQLLNPPTGIVGPSAAIPTVIQNGMKVCNLPDHPIHAGCTSVVAVIVDKILVVANAGDSRAVLCRAGGLTEPLSFDHKPFQNREMNRITNAGGFVNHFGRVNGNLNLSRSIGDLKYKQVPGISPADQMITAEPDIISTILRPGDEFIILGCDGIWDCLSNEECVKYVRDRIDSKSPCDIGIEMLDEILSEDPRASQGIGGDNMTIMIIDLLPFSRKYAHQ